MKCILSAGIESISGDQKMKNGKRLVFRTLRKESVNRGTKPDVRVYLRDSTPRATPPSAKELHNRGTFALASVYVGGLTAEQLEQYRVAYLGSGCKYKGKKYKTLRGYIFARFCANDLLV